MSLYLSSEEVEEEIRIVSVCPVCKGSGQLFEPVDWITGNKELIYPLGTGIKKVARNCPVCNNRVPWLRRHSGLEPQEMERKLHHWRVPKFKDVTLRLQREEARSVMERAIKPGVGLFTFWGDFGSGKTLALHIVLNELRELHQVEGYYAPFAKVLDHLLTLIRNDQSSSTYWERLLDIPVLALDEVTRFKATDWAAQQLFVLVDTRYRRRHSRLTLFATNEDPRQVLPPGDTLGYLYSRMREGELCELRGDVRSAVGA